MEIFFKEINPASEKDLNELSQLAHKIWNQYYPSIISQAQIEYMLAKNYTMESLRYQMTDQKHFINGAYIEDKMIGYLSYSNTGDEDYYIHKLYVNTDMHNKGIGRALFEHVFKNQNYKTIRLTVNRLNFKAVNFYFRLGFIIEKIIDIDIEEDFFMNDFMMIKGSGNKK